jgi:hypothetical protein
MSYREKKRIIIQRLKKSLLLRTTTIITVHRHWSLTPSNLYCDGFGVSYETTSQNMRYVRYERCYSTVGYAFGVSYATAFQIHGTNLTVKNS